MLRKNCCSSRFYLLLRKPTTCSMLGGSGFVWTKYSSESSVLSSDKVTASTVDGGIFMRESIFLGMRYGAIIRPWQMVFLFLASKEQGSHGATHHRRKT
ncbi:MAG: hypothetical protein U1F16_02150 [Turneriella sp.]